MTGPGVLDVTVCQQKDSLNVHLVNLTNPIVMKGPASELFRVVEQKMRLRQTDWLREKRLLTADTVVPVERQVSF